MNQAGGSTDPWIGQTLDHGRYDIVELIGQGGMGRVYKARQKSVDRLVAIKFLQGRFTSDGALRQRFTREAKMVAKLRNPHCVMVHDYGEAEDGSIYMVMELLQGLSLRSILSSSGPLSLKFTLEYGIQIAQGLEAAHSQGVIHRDLKPENIHIEYEKDGTARARVLDFGIAKILRGNVEPTEGLTEPGAVFGTPKYMAPEQAHGETVDGRCDIYALGLVLTEMLTGRHPFGTMAPMQLLIAQVQDTPRRVSDIRPGVPEAFADLIQSCLAKSVDDRPESMTAVIHALTQIQRRIPETMWFGEVTASAAVEPNAVSSHEVASPTNVSSAPMSAAIRDEKSVPTPYPSAHKVSVVAMAALLGVIALSIVVFFIRPFDDSPNASSVSDRAQSQAVGSTDDSPPMNRRAPCRLGRPPAYGEGYAVCTDEKTIAYWSFDQNFVGDAAEPRQPVKPLEKSNPRVKIVSDKDQGQNAAFLGAHDSRITTDLNFKAQGLFTVELSVYPTKEKGTHVRQRLIGNGVSQATNPYVSRIREGWGIDLLIGADDTFRVEFVFANANDEQTETLQSSVGIRSNEWSTIAIIVDRETISLVVNGLVTQMPHRPPLKVRHPPNVVMGGVPLNAGAQFFRGRLDDVRLSDGVRNMTEIQAHQRYIRSPIQGEPLRGIKSRGQGG